MIYLWSDPHLGLKRTSHTTPASRVRWAEEIRKQAEHCASHSPNICLGDLFDTSENEEAVIASAAEVLGNIRYCLSGNHDVPNRDSKLSSFQLLEELHPDGYLVPEGVAPWDVLLDACKLTLIGHHRTQESFEAALDAVKGGHVLLLHCNYNSGFVDNDYTLNLTKEKAKQLLTKYHYVLLGHEHISRTDFDGGLILLGNIFPTSFSDISDKYLWKYDGATLTPVVIWAKDQHYLSVDWDDLLSKDIDLVGLQFIDITGQAPAEKLPEISRAIQRLWNTAPDILAIRNGVERLGSITVETTDAVAIQDVPTRIAADLQNSPLLPLFNSYMERLR